MSLMDNGQILQGPDAPAIEISGLGRGLKYLVRF